MSPEPSLDETLDRKGMAKASNLDRQIWTTFFAVLTEQAKSLPSPDVLEFGFSESEQNIIVGLPLGTNVQTITNVRQGQEKFRKMVLSSYDEKCAITGISHSELLVAGHIRPWALDAENRMNPKNGICLNRLHDKAFEDGLITILPSGSIAYSAELNLDTKSRMILMNDTGVFNAPRRFRPDPVFLEYHRDVIFKP
jgi:putative restriction endonuclease